MKKTIYVLSFYLIFFWLNSYTLAGQSIIVLAEGYSCMGIDKSRRDTEKEARAEARRNALENALTTIKSTTKVKDFQVEKDLIDAYSAGKVTIVEEVREKTGWYRDPAMGDCFKYVARAEVEADEAILAKLTDKQDFSEDSSSPLTVKLWTDKKEYRAGESVKIYLKGNRPFYVRILYKDAAGNISQILPNPYRRDNYFQGGVVYELPEGNRDRFQLEIAPPYGREELVLHASSAPLGDLEVEPKGGVYQVKSAEKEIGVKSRGIKLMGGVSSSQGEPKGAEFVETKIEVVTKD